MNIKDIEKLKKKILENMEDLKMSKFCDDTKITNYNLTNILYLKKTWVQSLFNTNKSLKEIKIDRLNIIDLGGVLILVK